MVNGKQRQKELARSISFKRSTPRRKPRQQVGISGPKLTGMLKVLAAVGALCGAAVALVFLERYVKETAPVSQDGAGPELAGVPAWVNEQLKEKVRAVARGDGESPGPGEDAALSVQRRIAEKVAWLDEVKVRITGDHIRIEGRWRKPVALVQSDPLKFYVDAEQVVLDYVPMPDLAIVEVTGLPPVTAMPPPGEVWHCNDLAAAIKILDRLDRMDRTLTPDKPLLREIERIDVSNFKGRQDSNHAHIILYSQDNTEIMWGAEMGAWQRNLESTDEEKLAKLYGYYKTYGTLCGGVKYINLRDPRDKIPLPIDRY